MRATPPRAVPAARRHGPSTGIFTPAHLVVVLVAGAGVEDRVAVAREGERGAERRARVGDLVDLAVGHGSAGALEQGRADRGRVLEPRVEVGDDDDVGAAGRDGAHLGALGGVAVAVGAEHHDRRWPVGELADRAERLQERVGAVAVVDVDDRAAVARDALGAAGDVRVDAAVALERLARWRRGRSPASTSMTIASAALAAMYQPSSGTRVSRRRPSGALEHERGVRRALVEHGRCASRRRRRASVVSVVTGMRDSVDEAPAPVGVDRDDAAARAVGLEQLELRLEVLLHRRVVVEVVVAEVREADDVEDETVDAVPRQRLGRDLDRRRRARRPRACGRAARAARSPRASSASS